MHEIHTRLDMHEFRWIKWKERKTKNAIPIKFNRNEREKDEEKKSLFK